MQLSQQDAPPQVLRRQARLEILIEMNELAQAAERAHQQERRGRGHRSSRGTRTRGAKLIWALAIAAVWAALAASVVLLVQYTRS